MEIVHFEEEVFQILRTIDRMNPIQRIDYFCLNYDKETMVYCNQILLILLAIDEVIKEKLGYESFSFYIEDDCSIKYVLENTVRLNKFDDIIFKKALYLLDISKLVYRFTCAKKFEVQDDSIKQLRLNSWGRMYLACTYAQIADLIEYESIKRFLEKYIIENENLYRKLIEILSELSKENVRFINEINQKVQIKLLV